MCKFGDPPGSSNFHTGLEDAQPKFQIVFWVSVSWPLLLCRSSLGASLGSTKRSKK